MKHLICDIGNVLLSMQFDKFLAAIGESCHWDREKCLRWLEQKEHLQNLGYYSMKNDLLDAINIPNTFSIMLDDVEIARKTREVTQNKVNYLMELWQTTLTPNPNVLGLLNTLRAIGIQVALFSNMGKDHFEIMPQLLGKIYDTKYKWFSFQVGATKPQKMFYHTFLSHYPEFKGAWYIDDKEENLTTGREYGLKTIHFDLSGYKDVMKLNEKLDWIKKEITNG